MSDEKFATYEAKCATAARRRVEVLPRNKRVLFEALAVAGIAVVTIGFDGSGDSGQFDAPVAFDAENREVAIPTSDIIVKVAEFETGTIREQTTTPVDYIETLACDFLEDTHGGWENDEGGYGEFTFDLAECGIKLEYNERYTETNHHEHEF